MIFHELRSTIFPSDQILGTVGMFVHRILTLDPERTMSLDTIAPERRLGEITDVTTAVKNLSEEVVTVLEDQDAPPLPAGDLSLINAPFGPNLAKFSKPMLIPSDTVKWVQLQEKLEPFYARLKRVVATLKTIARSYFRFDPSRPSQIGTHPKISVQLNSGLLFSPF